MPQAGILECAGAAGGDGVNLRKGERSVAKNDAG